MIDLKDIENAEAVELDLEEQREVNGGQYGSGAKSNSTLTDHIYYVAWKVWYQY